MKMIFRFCLLIVMTFVWLVPEEGSGGDRSIPEEQKQRQHNGSQKESGRNPFSDTDLIQKQAEQRVMGMVTPSSRLPEGVPNLLLRGYIEGEDKRPAALLEVHGVGTYIVRDGDTLSLHAGQQNILLKIREVRNQSAIVTVGMRGQEIVVR